MSLHKRESSRNYAQTKTQQAPKDQVDVNHIVRKYMTPSGPRVPSSPGAFVQPNWGEWQPEDFQLQLNRISDAKLAFQNLPAKIRGLFQNQPLQLVRFVNNPQNLHKAIELGLIPIPDGYTPPPAKPTRNAQQMDLELEALRAEIIRLQNPQKPPEEGV